MAKMGLLSVMLGAFLLASSLASSAHAAERQKLAVLDFEAKGVDKSTAETLTDLVTVSLKKLGVFDVISRSDIQQMLNFEESKQLVGCTSSSNCVAEIGGALGVAKVVSGSVGKVGTSYVINLTLLDTKSAKVIERESRTSNTQEKMVQDAQAGARFLVRSLLEGKQGDLILKVAEANAEVEIDGKLVGMTPMPRMKMVSGPHTVRINKKGFISYAKDVIIDEKEPTVLDVSLIPSMDFIGDYDKKANGIRIGAYLATGLGVAMVVAGSVLFYGIATPQGAQQNAAFSALEASNPTDEQKRAHNTKSDSIDMLYTVGQVLAYAGIPVTIAGVLMFALGPKPGVYDQYKTVEVGGTKVSFDVMPTNGGAYATGGFRW